MAFNDRSLDDYIDVPQRIADFRERYPNGSLRPADLAMPYHVVRVPCGWCLRCKGRQVIKDGAWKQCPRCKGSGLRSEGEPTEDVFIVYTAAAYRTPDDAQPGIGSAWEVFPGLTPYTSGSELQNAETSAWGRAIVAALASDAKKGVASREEIRNRDAEFGEEPPPQRGERERPPPRPVSELPRNQDGTISRSQTTDEEKNAAGVMTDAQQKAHSALRKGDYSNAVPGTQRLTHTPDDDPWQSDLPPEERPGSIGPGDQMPRLQAAFSRLFARDERDQRLHAAEQIVGRQLTGPHKGRTSKNLSRLEAKKLIDTLDGLDREQLIERMAAEVGAS